MQRIKTLESQKMTLVAQVKKLQASLARCSGQTAPSSTCLLVFVMSLALILAPNLRNTNVSSDNADDEGISLNDESQSAPSSPGMFLMTTTRRSRELCNVVSSDRRSFQFKKFVVRSKESRRTGQLQRGS